MQPKFYADENVPFAIVKALKQRKIDVVAVKEIGLSGKSDIEQLDYAIRNRRTIITHDPDFFDVKNHLSKIGAWEQ